MAVIKDSYLKKIVLIINMHKLLYKILIILLLIKNYL